MGIAYLSKSYLALIAVGIAIVVWIAERIYTANTGKSFLRQQLPLDKTVRDHNLKLRNNEFQQKSFISIRGSDVGLQLFSAIGIVAPWIIYCLIHYPQEFLWEHKSIIAHLNTNVEEWSSSWDRTLFDYMPLFYPLFYIVLVVSVLCLIVVLLKRWRMSELFVLIWAIGVIVPHTLAQTKTPSATMIAVPPLLICLAVVISRSWQPNDWIYTAIWTSAMLTIIIIPRGNTVVGNHSLFDGIGKFAPFVQTNYWILHQLFLFGMIFSIISGIYFLIPEREWQKRVWQWFRGAAFVLSLLYAVYYVSAAYYVTERNRNSPLYETIGQDIQRNLPRNACLFLDDDRAASRLELMFYADRSTYQDYDWGMKKSRDFVKDANKARAAGAIPYLFSIKETEHDYPLVIEGKVTVDSGRVQRYRVFEITGTNN